MKKFEDVTVKVSRSKRKTVSLQMACDEVGALCLLVKAPLHIEEKMITDILEQKRDWIINAKTKIIINEEKKQTQFLHYSIENGGKLPFMGQDVLVKVFVEPDVLNVSFKAYENRIEAFINPNVKDMTWLITKEIETFYKKTAYSTFSNLIEQYVHQYGFKVKNIRIKDTKTRWGSCSNKMMINLHWKLILAHKDIYEYVIVHELCHLGCWNHGDRFWKRVESILPNYRDTKMQLKELSSSLSAFEFTKLSVNI